MSDADKERLRSARRKFDKQQKFSGYYEQTANPGPGELRLTQNQEHIRAHNKRKISRAVGHWAEHIPTSAEFMTGIPHKNSNIENENRLFGVVRAIATAKVDTFPKI